MKNDVIGLLAAGNTTDVVNAGYQAFLKVVNIVFPVVLGVLLVFGMIYAIILGVNYAKAEDTEKREEAYNGLRCKRSP